EILQDRRKVLRKEEEEVRFSMRRNPLFRKLLRLRLEIAEREKVAPYIIFSDLTLWEFSQFRPRTKYDMMKIQGVGNQKFSQYGEEFLACILQEEE
ncbi:HRDC domain-containing protein, partial [Fusobacterium necrophorum]